MTRLLDFFPQTIHGTLLFTHIVQYHRLAANTNTQTTRTQLLGSHKASASGRFGALSGRLFDVALAERYSTASEMLRAHTMVPYYGAFMSPELLTRWEQEILWRTGRTFRTYLGGPTRPFFRPKLQMCEACVAEDLRRHGVGLWHVRHQLPGVKYCSLHWMPLIWECSNCGEALASEWKWELPTLDCPRCQHSLAVGNHKSPVDVMRNFIAASVRLLSEGAPLRSLDIRRDAYMAHMKIIGIDPSDASCGARVAAMVCAQWGVADLRELQLRLETPIREDHLPKAVSGMIAPFYPALHIVLGNALGIPQPAPGQSGQLKPDLQSRLSTWRAEFPEGIRSTMLTDNEAAQFDRGIAEVADVLSARGAPEFLALAIASGHSPNSLHRQFGVSWATVAEAARSLKIAPPVASHVVTDCGPRQIKSRSVHTIAILHKVAAAREKVLQYVSQDNAPSRTKLAREHKGLAKFMRAHDRDWFDQTLPSLGPCFRERNSRIPDIPAFDRSLAKLLAKVKDEVSLRGNRPRLSVNLANRIAGFRLDIYFASGRLPVSAAVIRGHGEDNIGRATLGFLDSIGQSESSSECRDDEFEVSA